MKEYSNYKKVNLKWLGKIPSHWDIVKNRYVFQKKNNGSNKNENETVLSLTINGVKIKKNLNYGKTTESYLGHQIVKKGDIIFTPRDFDCTPILSGVSDYDGCISNLYIVDKPNDRLIPDFVNYYWHALKFKFNYFKNFSHGMRFSFNRFQFDEIPILIPKLDEQKQIIEFLDYKVKKIDSLIKKINEEILLNRQLILSQYLKNSEVKKVTEKWYQKIPKKWSIVPLKKIFETKSIKDNKNERLISVTQEDGLIYRDEQINKVMSPEGDLSTYKLVEPGDFVISLRSFEGGFEFSDKRGIVSNAYTVLKPKITIDEIFYKYLFKSKNFITELNRNITGIRDGKNINFDDIKHIQIPINPEKKENSSLIVEKCIIFKKDYIKYLEELKLSFIANVCLGNIDINSLKK